MPAWSDGVKLEGDKDQDQLQKDIVQIASNILTALSVAAAYLVIGFVMWGGYLYMFSSGDPGKVTAAKKTLTHAFIGLGITISAYTIFSAIRIALMGSRAGDFSTCIPTESDCIVPGTMITSLIQWVAGIAGVVSLIFIVMGGWGYISSAGDPNKLAKAKSTILYALIGLMVVALAEIITAFVASTIRNANDAASAPPTYVIAQSLKKEVK